MAQTRVNNRVRETTTTIGTGTISLGGPSVGYQSFWAAIGSGNQTYYTITNNSYQWEVGIGTVGGSSAAPTLTRDTVLTSSSSGAKVDFNAGSKDIYLDAPAQKALLLDATGRVNINQNSSAVTPNVGNTGIMYISNSIGAVGDNLNFITFGYNAGNSGAIQYDGGSYLNFNSVAGFALCPGAAPTSSDPNTGSPKFRMDSTGRIGIGTAAPQAGYQLYSSGAIYSQTSISSSSGFSWGGGVNTSASLTISYNTATLSVLGDIIFSTTFTEKMRITQTGNVGIGNTPSGTYKLEVTGSVGASSFIPTSSTIPTNGMYLSTTNTLGFATNSTLRFTVSSTGNVSGTAGTTSMTDGFFYIPAAAGAPTGVPTAITGTVPMYYDTTNNKFYIYNGAWKQVTLA